MIKNQPIELIRLTELINQLSMKSINYYYNPYRLFSWAEHLPENQYWMSPDLMTIYGSVFMDEFSVEQLYRLSKWESIHFYSLNVHGIRELLLEVITRIHQPGYELISDFLHHFIGEENEHMWFFSEFCRRYGQKIYPSFALPNPTRKKYSSEIETFLVFARILIFEELVDFYNLRMARDTTLPEIIRQVNRIHHQDEARHIAFGRKLIALLYQEIQKQLSEPMEIELESYLKQYIRYCLNSFYNPQIYLDAGISDPLAFRANLIQLEARKKIERQSISKSIAFFVKSGIFRDERLTPINENMFQLNVVGG